MDRTIALIIVTVLAAGVYGIYHYEKAWSEFSTAHHCTVVAHASGLVFNTVSSSGHVGVATTPDTTSYICDDGVTYTR